jgi:hypothetical protein
MRLRRHSVIVAADALNGLEALVAELNHSEGKKLSPSALEFRGIVKQWQDSGPNLWRLFGANPGLWAETQQSFRPSLIPTKNGNANMRLLDNAGAPGVMASLGQIGIRFFAVVWFNALTLNPLWRKLGGPCDRCEKYYIKKRRDQKVYCGRKCGRLISAEKSTRKRLDDERTKKVGRAQALIREWDTLRVRPKMDWKQWVHRRDKNITTKWLTTAINDKYGKYKLEPPQKG